MWGRARARDAPGGGAPGAAPRAVKPPRWGITMSLRFPHLSPQKTPPLRPSVRTPSLPLVESPIPKSYVRGFFSSAMLRCTWGT